MNILTINCDIGPLQGHCVRNLSMRKGGIVSLEKFLRASHLEQFHPDLLIQREALGVRIFINDLARFNCPKIFWAVDAHLNMYWQRIYAQLFDHVATPHVSLFRALPRCFQPHNCISLPFPGYDYPFKPYAQRPNFATFVGRINQHRQQRLRFATFLQERHAIHAQTLDFTAMFAAYTKTQVLPNESICNEFNFRIMEGASCGCCVVTEDIGEDLLANFSPNHEVLTYRQGEELSELLTFLKKRPNLAEKIGYAAWMRVQKEHLPQHRWQKLLSLNQKTRDPLSAEEVARTVLLASIQCQRAQNGALQEALLTQLQNASAYSPLNTDLFAMRIRLAVENNEQERCRELLTDPLLEKDSADFTLTVTALIAALFFDLADLASKLFSKLQKTSLPYNRFAYGICVADLLQKTNRIAQLGFSFDPDKNCPETALEMLLQVKGYATCGEELRIVDDKLSLLLKDLPLRDFAIQIEQERLNYESNWQTMSDYGLAKIAAFYIDDGKRILKEAAEIAQNLGEKELFNQKIQRYIPVL